MKSARFPLLHFRASTRGISILLNASVSIALLTFRHEYWLEFVSEGLDIWLLNGVHALSPAGALLSVQVCMILVVEIEVVVLRLRGVVDSSTGCTVGCTVMLAELLQPRATMVFVDIELSDSRAMMRTERAFTDCEWADTGVTVMVSSLVGVDLLSPNFSISIIDRCLVLFKYGMTDTAFAMVEASKPISAKSTDR